eukprot:15365186-Ditylum_brightwellii.AAC.2
MSTVVNSNAFKPHEIRQINYCRLYLGVTVLSNITLADSETLDPHMRSGNISLLSSSAKQLLSKQGCPSQKSWKTWSKCLKLFANKNQVKVPLKQWLVPMSDLQQKFYISIPVSPIISTFESHLNTLQEWEQMLLKNTACHKPIHHIAHLMARPTTIILVASNGSASEQENTLSFGWVISLLDSTTLATHSGPAFGHTSLF